MNIDPQIVEKLSAWRNWSDLAHDAVTGLPNRRQMQEQLAQAVARAQRLDENLAILIVDVDAFRIVNAAAGQAAGDALLAAAAERLASCAPGHLTARTGDNEFTILLDGEPPESILDTTTAVLTPFHEPFAIGVRDLHVTVSVGMADLARDGEGADFLLRAATAALRRAKELGGNQRQHSSSALTLAEFERLHVQQQIRRAIRNGELSLVYQPQLQLSDGRVIGLEALLRWTKDGRTIPAGAFIRAIERSAVIIDHGEWVLEGDLPADRRVLARLPETLRHHLPEDRPRLRLRPPLLALGNGDRERHRGHGPRARPARGGRRGGDGATGGVPHRLALRHGTRLPLRRADFRGRHPGLPARQEGDAPCIVRRSCWPTTRAPS